MELVNLIYTATRGSLTKEVKELVEIKTRRPVLIQAYIAHLTLIDWYEDIGATY